MDKSFMCGSIDSAHLVDSKMMCLAGGAGWNFGPENG